MPLISGGIFHLVSMAWNGQFLWNIPLFHLLI
jgi:hypothetical protein